MLHINLYAATTVVSQMAIHYMGLFGKPLVAFNRVAIITLRNHALLVWLHHNHLTCMSDTKEIMVADS